MRLTTAQLLELADLSEPRRERRDVIELQRNALGEYEVRESNGEAARRIFKRLRNARERIDRWQRR